jgi:hypothetical protein
VLLLYFLCKLSAFKYTSPLVEFISINTYSSVDAQFYLFYARIDDLKLVLNSRQQLLNI